MSTIKDFFKELITPPDWEKLKAENKIFEEKEIKKRKQSKQEDTKKGRAQKSADKNWRDFFIFLVVLGIVGYLIISPFDNSLYQNGVTERAYVNDSFSDVKELHWTHMPLTYRFNTMENCHVAEDERVREAFRIISEETGNLVAFSETNEKADIEIHCISLYALAEVANTLPITCMNLTYSYRKTKFSPYFDSDLDMDINYITKSESIKITANQTIYEICYVNISDYNSSMIPDCSQFYYSALGLAQKSTEGNIIINATLTFLRQTDIATCGSKKPLREIHEVLHVLGFIHNAMNITGYEISNEANKLKTDIMYPYQDCSVQKGIDAKYLSCLKKIYSNEESPGDCSEINMSKSCEGGYILGNDNECHKECTEKGYILGEDYKCYKSCGSRCYYCAEDYTCCHNQCVSCPANSSLGQDCECYPL